MSPVSPTRRDEEGTHEGGTLDSFSSSLLSPVSPPQWGDQWPNQRDTDANLPEVYVEVSPQALWPEGTQNAPISDPHDKYGINDDETLKTAIHQEPAALGLEPPGATAASEPNSPPVESAKSTKILGIKRKTFFIVLAIVLIVIAAAVGGGVGGSLASSSKSDSSSPDDDASETSSAVTTTPTSSEPSDAAPTTVFLNETVSEDDVFGFQAWTGHNYSGTISRIIRQEGGTALNFTATSYVWKPVDSWCCISFCNSTTYDGEGVPDWICDERYREEASSAFKRIFMWCGQQRVTENSRCSDTQSL